MLHAGQSQYKLCFLMPRQVILIYMKVHMIHTGAIAINANENLILTLVQVWMGLLWSYRVGIQSLSQK